MITIIIIIRITTFSFIHSMITIIIITMNNMIISITISITISKVDETWLVVLNLPKPSLVQLNSSSPPRDLRWSLVIQLKVGQVCFPFIMLRLNGQNFEPPSLWVWAALTQPSVPSEAGIKVWCNPLTTWLSKSSQIMLTVRSLVRARSSGIKGVTLDSRRFQNRGIAQGRGLTGKVSEVTFQLAKICKLCVNLNKNKLQQKCINCRNQKNVVTKEDILSW